MKKTNTEPRSIQELESWQILEELSRIAAIKDELKALNLKADQSDPDTGYNLSDILLYEEGLLKEVRDQTKRIINLPLLNNKYCYIYFYHLFLYTSNIQRLSFLSY